MVTLLSWNLHGLNLWPVIAADATVDVALLQEARCPEEDCPLDITPTRDSPWFTAGWERRHWRTAIARVSDRVSLRPRATFWIGDRNRSGIVVSRPGTLTAVDVVVGDTVAFTAVSMYAAWERPPGEDSPIASDSSAHRLLSDLATLVWGRSGHRIVAAGDLNILFGYGDYGSPYWRDRYATVFERARAMGLHFAGPRHPSGRQAEPWPEELPIDSMNVPTYHTHAKGPAGASRQMDFVFVSQDLAERTRVRALNEPATWGRSDHCQILIEVDV